jgi:hypothetical protein
MSHNFKIVNGDTDSISFKKADEAPFSKEERIARLAEINARMPKYIEWEDDDFLKKFIVVKAKNYIMLNEADKLTIKGSALKATLKEKALQKFINEIIQILVHKDQSLVYELYLQYARDIIEMKDITQWCSKHTITKSVLNGKGTTQVRIRESLGDTPVQEGDKVYMFFKGYEERCLVENFDGTYDQNRLFEKLHKTVSVFKTIFGVKKFPKLSIKKNKAILESLGGTWTPKPKKSKKEDKNDN